MPFWGWWVGKDLLTDLKAEYTLRETPYTTESLALSRNITPIINVGEVIGEAAREPKFKDSGEIASAAGFVVLLTVPADKKWEVSLVQCYRTTGATAELDRLTLGDGTNLVYLHIVAPASGTFYVTDHAIELDEGWEIGIKVSTHNAGDKFTMYAIVMEVDKS